MEIRVLGAGCLGLSAALALAERGHDVRVEDPRPGSGATGRGAGIVSTMTWNDDDFHLVQRTRGRIGELIAEAAMEGREARGTWRSMDSLAIAAEEGLRHMDDVQHRLERLGEEPVRLDAATARADYPMLAIGDGEEVLVAQEDGCVEPGDLLELLRWACDQQRVSMDAGPAEATVVAAGAWTPGLLDAPLPLASFRAQLASLGYPGDVPLVHDTVHGLYVRPESPGSVMVGDGTRLWPHDPDDYDGAADPGFREDVAAGIVERLRDAGDAVWRRGWAGLCVGTPDRHPVCGRVPGSELFVLSGDNGFGIMRCLALGERLADSVDGDEAPVTSPVRFAGFDEEWHLQEGFAW